MIVSASHRTDIPAFYFDWFCNRLREGCVDVVNPFNRKQVSRVSLKPEAVDCIVFWTKDPAPMLVRLDDLSAYCYYVQISITPYGKDIEENFRPKPDIIKTVQELSRRLGSMTHVFTDAVIATQMQATRKLRLALTGMINSHLLSREGYWVTKKSHCTNEEVVLWQNIQWQVLHL